MIPTPTTIIELTAKEWSVTVDELLSSARPLRLVIPRNAAMWIMREKLKMKLDPIGYALGGRDHSQASYGVMKHRDEMETNARVKEMTERVVARLMELPQ